MNKPSNDWIARLQLVILECEAETGQQFGEFCEKTFAGYKRMDTKDYVLSALLDRLKLA